LGTGRLGNIPKKSGFSGERQVRGATLLARPGKESQDVWPFFATPTRVRPIEGKKKKQKKKKKGGATVARGRFSCWRKKRKSALFPVTVTTATYKARPRKKRGHRSRTLKYTEISLGTQSRLQKSASRRRGPGKEKASGGHRSPKIALRGDGRSPLNKAGISEHGGGRRKKKKRGMRIRGAAPLSGKGGTGDGAIAYDRPSSETGV